MLPDAKLHVPANLRLILLQGIVTDVPRLSRALSGFQWKVTINYIMFGGTAGGDSRDRLG